jgi:hypothetical protein
MWLLVIVILAFPGRPIVIDTFANQEDCQEKRNSVGFNMAEAYPYERDFTIECQLQARVI